MHPFCLFVLYRCRQKHSIKYVFIKLWAKVEIYKAGLKIECVVSCISCCAHVRHHADMQMHV